MKRLLFGLVLFPTAAIAELLPEGCYVAFSNIDFCYVPSGSDLTWVQSTDINVTAPTYGLTMALIIKNGYQEELAKNVFDAQFDDLLVDYNSLVAQFNAQNAALVKAQKQVRKLKKQLKAQ